MLVDIVENRKAVDDELSSPKFVGAQKHTGRVPAGRRITRGEGCSDHLRRRVLSVEKIVRPHGAVVIHVEDAFALQSLEHPVRLGYAFLVIEHVLKTEDTSLLRQRKTRCAIFLAFESLGSEKYH